MVGKTQAMKVWQRLLVMLTLAFALVILADGFKIISRAETGTTNTAVNMRKTPSKNGDLVKKVEQGTTVELGNLVDGKDGDGKKWYEVTVGGSSGYIRSDLITKGSGNAGTTTTTSTEVEAVTPVGATIAGSNTVRVRTSPSTKTSNNILTTANKGTEVTVIGKTTGDDKQTWYQVKLEVGGKTVAGYVRSDYLALTGEIKPLDSDPVQENPDPVQEQPEEQPEKKPEETEVKKRYETKMINDEWWILDYDKGEQYKIDELFGFVDKYTELSKESTKAQKSSKFWIAFLIILALAFAGVAAYLVYKIREIREDAYISDIENNTPRKTAERPRGEARGGNPAGKDRPAIKDGLEPRGREEAQRQGNAQKAAGNNRQQGQRPVQGQPGQGQRPVQGQPGQGQRPVQGQPGQGQRPVQGQPGQGQRPMQGQPGQGQRPVQGQPGQSQRPMQGQPGQGQRPAGAPEQRPAGGQPAQASPARPKNFVQDSDDMEFEFLNWDSDE